MNTHPISVQADRNYGDAWWFIAIVGLALGGSGLLHVYLDPEPLVVQLFEGVLVIAPAVAILGGAVWIRTRQLDPETEWEIATWCLFGTVLTGVLMSSYLFAEWSVGSTVDDWALLFVTAMLAGGLIGLVASIATQQLATTASSGEVESSTRTAIESLSSDDPSGTTLESSSFSRHTVRMVLRSDEPISVFTLATELAALEGTSEETAYNRLVDAALPALEATGLVEYDRDNQVVQVSEQVSAIIVARDELKALETGSFKDAS